MAVKRKYSGDGLEQFVTNANEVINFKFVLSEKEIEESAITFKPEYTHQIFGDNENIFGYIGLEINLLYSACQLFPLFQMSYRQIVNPSMTGGIEADDVYKIITDKVEYDISKDLDSFIESLPEESKFKPFGKLLNTFMIENEEYGVYRADSTTPGFIEYHERMQTLILWLVDAASYIDSEDVKWDYFVLHKHCKDGEYYPFVGYTTVYRYYAYPCLLRPRISQMLVLPQYQKKGLGSKLLETICNCYVKDPDVVDITVEDPSEDFVRLRDVIDCRNCQTLPIFSKEKLDQGFSNEMAEEAKKHFKINKKQARRVYEILRLKYTDTSNEKEYKAYRLNVKNRLNIPFQKEKLDLEKVQKTITDEELNAVADPIPREQRIEQLEHMYGELEEKYKRVIEKLQEVNGKV